MLIRTSKMEKVFLTSLTRASDLHAVPFEVVDLPRTEWSTGDFVAARIDRPPRGFRTVELSTGREAEVVGGDLIIGALGERFATLEAVGSWRDVGEDGHLHALTAAGLLGRVTSLSNVLPPLLSLQYEGHVSRAAGRVTMSDFVPSSQTSDYRCPTILFIGTSMSAGKTASAKVAVRLLKRRGLRVVGCKLSGAGRLRDILGMQDAGADAIFDFVDVGLPSTICPKDEFRRRLERLLGLIASAGPDVVVAEAGASPMEPYNGDTVVEMIRDQVQRTVLCASDPYAVVGVMEGFQAKPDLISGLAASTSAGRELIRKLTGIDAVSMLDPMARSKIESLFSGVASGKGQTQS